MINIYEVALLLNLRDHIPVIPIYVGGEKTIDGENQIIKFNQNAFGSFPDLPHARGNFVKNALRELR